MKKLLFVCVLCGITSIATAGLSLDVSATEAMPGDTITVNVVDDGMSVSGFNVFSLTIDNAVNGSYTLPLGPGMLNTFSEGAVDGGYAVTGGASYFGAMMPADGVMLSATFDVPADFQGLIKIAATGTVNLQAADLGATVNVVPEPMTLGLLGLGGLFLRRRRA